MAAKRNAVKTNAKLLCSFLFAHFSNKSRPTLLCLVVTNRYDFYCKYYFVKKVKIGRKILITKDTKAEAASIVRDFYDVQVQMIFLSDIEPPIHKNIGDIINYIVGRDRYASIYIAIFLPINLDETYGQFLSISAKDYKKIWQGYLELKNKWRTITNSPSVIKKVLDWIGYYAYLTEKQAKKFNYEPIANEEIYTPLDAKRKMYPYINSSCLNYLSIRAMSFLEAFAKFTRMKPGIYVVISGVIIINMAIELSKRIFIPIIYSIAFRYFGQIRINFYHYNSPVIPVIIVGVIDSFDYDINRSSHFLLSKYKIFSSPLVKYIENIFKETLGGCHAYNKKNFSGSSLLS